VKGAIDDLDGIITTLQKYNVDLLVDFTSTAMVHRLAS
jgi:hypothetical protein